MGNLLAINGNIINSQEPLPIPVELMTKLWENPDPTSAFAAQTITLANDDYDFLLWIVKDCSSICSKGSGATFSIASRSSGQPVNYIRASVYISDTSYSITDCNGGLNNDMLIPLVIYGFKKTVSFVSGSNCDVEYKLVATGTTLDSLKTAIKALSRADYMKSYINIVDDSLNAGNIMMMPEDGRDFVKAFGGISSPYNASYISRHWRVIYNANNDTISYGVYSQPVSGSMSEHYPNIATWYLYTLKPV